MNGFKQYFIDTNIFVRFFVPDRFSAECQKLLQDLVGGVFSAFTSALVLGEIHHVLASFYKFPKVKTSAALRAVASLRNLTIEDSYHIPLALDIYQKHNVKFVDCLIASNPLIAEGRVTVISYDHDFDKLGIKRLEPKEVPGK